MNESENPAAAAIIDTAKRRQILEGARAVFLKDGFDGASMNDIARCASVSKGTVYAYFPSKEALFEAFIIDEKGRQAEQLCRPNVIGDNLAAELERFTTDLLSVMVSVSSIAHVRTVIGAAAKHPAIGIAYYQAGPLHGARQLAAFFKEQAALGRLAIDDADEAATVFIDLAKSNLFPRLLFGVDPHVSREHIEKNASRAVRLFMRLYAVG